MDLVHLEWVGRARALSSALKTRLKVMLPSPNHLLSRLLHTTPEAAEHLERVGLSTGLWPAPDAADDGDHLYFPEKGLMGLFWTGRPSSGVGMALLGCHACWWPGDWRVSPLQTQVLQAGHAQRIRWSVLQALPQRYAPWLLQAAAASQQLVHQLAQLAFCAQNHNRLQRLASGLLLVLYQNPHGDGQMSLAELAQWLTCSEAEVLVTAQTLQAHGALQLRVDAGAGAQLHSLQPQPLASLACSCHSQVVQGQQASGFAQR